MKRPITTDVPIDRPALDPERVENAKRRARTHLLAARHHERSARVERAKVASLAHTWGFDSKDLA